MKNNSLNNIFTLFFLLAMISHDFQVNTVMIKSDKTKDQCDDMIYFINTFNKADAQLDEISKNFTENKIIHKDLKTTTPSSVTKTTNNENANEENTVDFYNARIEEIRRYIKSIIHDVQIKLNTKCQERLAPASNEVITHIDQVSKQINKSQ